jgi:hypothetical protein
MKFICISNTTESDKIEIGKAYRLFKHEDPKIVWVAIDDPSNSIGYFTIMCYRVDFIRISEYRERQLNSLLG